jgi:hypothetical protein
MPRCPVRVLLVVSPLRFFAALDPMAGSWLPGSDPQLHMPIERMWQLHTIRKRRAHEDLPGAVAPWLLAGAAKRPRAEALRATDNKPPR